MTEQRRKPRGGLTGDTIGGILAGFDQQIMRNQPPPHELVHKGSPVRGLSGEGGSHITISLPDETTGIPSTCDLMDEWPDDHEVCELPLRQFGRVRRFAGRIRTVRCHEDNVLLREVLETPGAGGILVVDGGGSLRTALMGDVIASLAAEHGWAGVVVNGCVRDVEALTHLAIGILAMGANPRPSAKAGAGEVDVPLTFGGATFRPGAFLTVDEDGIVVTRAVIGS